MLIAVALVLAFKVEQRPLNERDAQYANSVAEAALNAKGVANDQRGFLLSGDPMFIHEADRRIRDVRTNFAAAITAAAGPTQRQAVNDARIGFERWVQTMQGEFTSFQAGDRQRAIAASLGPDRTLRKTYEQSLASAQALDAFSTRSSTRSSAATSSRWSWILFAGLVAALSIGVGVAFRDDLS
jgi:methyl-accepting chemotaxis protein